MHREELPKSSIIDSARFGEIQIDTSLLFDFVAPIIGYDKYTYFALIDNAPDSPFKWLQSVEDMDLAFPITLCSFFGIDYQFDIPDEEAQKLEITSGDDVFVCNIANIPSSNPQGATINMLAPIVINIVNKKAMQIILKNTEFEVRKKLFDEEGAGEQ